MTTLWGRLAVAVVLVALGFWALYAGQWLGGALLLFMAAWVNDGVRRKTHNLKED